MAEPAITAVVWVAAAADTMAAEAVGLGLKTHLEAAAVAAVEADRRT